jgi:hypothetical protein
MDILDRPLEDEDALGFLQGVYRNRATPLSIRMRAAALALEFERPKLAVTANLTGEDFGEALERARKRVDGGPPQPLLAQPATQTDLSAKPMVSDRRFRRT